MEVKKKGSKKLSLDRFLRPRNGPSRPQVAPPEPPKPAELPDSKSTFCTEEESSDNAEGSKPQHRKEKSRSREIKCSSSKFYVGLADEKQNTETSPDNGDEAKSDHVTSQTPDDDVNNTQETGKEASQTECGATSSKEATSHVRKTRLFFECNANPVIPSETNSPKSQPEASKSEKERGAKAEPRAETQNTPREVSCTEEDTLPIAPLRKRKSLAQKKRIETLDCSSQAEVSLGNVDFKMATGAVNPKKVAVDFLKLELGSAMKSNSLEKKTPLCVEKSTVIQDAKKSAKSSQNSPHITPVTPKPQILRPKPLLRVTRKNVASFTTEDFDICRRKSVDDMDSDSPSTKASNKNATGRMSRKDLNLKNKMDIGKAKRRSRSLGTSNVAAIIQRLTMKPSEFHDVNMSRIPEKPVLQSKPNRILPTLPTSSPKTNDMSQPKQSSDKLSTKEFDDVSEASKPTTNSKQSNMKEPGLDKPAIQSKTKRLLPNVPQSSQTSSNESLHKKEQNGKSSGSVATKDLPRGESPKPSPPGEQTLKSPPRKLPDPPQQQSAVLQKVTLRYSRPRSKSPVESDTVYGDVMRLSVSLDAGLEKISGNKNDSPSKQVSTNVTEDGSELKFGDRIQTSHDQNHNVPDKTDDNNSKTEGSPSKSTSYKVKIITERHRVDPVYEDIQDSHITTNDKPPAEVKEDKLVDATVAGVENSPMPKKLPRKPSHLRKRKETKSFRQRVYEDVYLKEEIPEGVDVESVEFSMSDDDSWYSETSFTDDEDIEFEQTQAKELGLSPYQNVEKTDEGGLEPVSVDTVEAEAEEAAPIPEYAKDKLYQIANEILMTERAYVEKLHLIDQVFHFQLLLDNRQHHFLPEDHIPHIFLNIKSIYQFHDFLLKQLEERMTNWVDVKKIGDVMMRWAPFLKLYAEYINNFDNAMSVFNNCMKTCPKFVSIVEEIQKKPECGMLTLQHHMLQPIQRVPRYELLLKDYLKHLPEDSPDKDDTQRALELVAKAAAHANETIRKTERSQKLLSLSERLIGSSSLDLFNPTRELIKEGSITKISARDGSHLVRYLFLFNDYLLVCVPVSFAKLGIKHQYKIKTKLDVEGMRVMEGDDLYTPNTFQVKSKTKSIEFHSSTAEEKDEWQAMLWNTIGEYTKKKMSRMTGPTLTENFQEDELGKRAPTWIKDQAASMCMLCAREFTTFFRRHHCRACGRVICGNCSARKARLLYDNNRHNRICDNCYNVLELKLEPDAILSSGMLKKTKGLHGVKASDPSLISGYLNMSQSKKTWEKRFFAIRNDFVLYSFKAHQDLFATTSLPLPGYVVGAVKEDQSGGNFTFKLFHISLKKAYYFQADDSKSYQKWMSILEKVVRAELPDEEEQLTPPGSPCKVTSTEPQNKEAPTVS